MYEIILSDFRRMKETGVFKIFFVLIIMPVLFFLTDCASGNRWVVLKRIDDWSLKHVDRERYHFSVCHTYVLSGTEQAPANIPEDAIAFALTDFVGIDKNYEYLNRVVKAIKEGLAIYGKIDLFCVNDDESYWIILMYKPSQKHLVIYDHLGGKISSKVYAVDLSKVDVSIK
jgi:hypothetical protein